MVHTKTSFIRKFVRALPALLTAAGLTAVMFGVVTAHEPLAGFSALFSLAPEAVDITATKTDALVVDVDGDTVADAGDTLQYTIVVTNGGSTNALDTLVTDVISDALVTLVGGSVNVSPIAANDVYTTVGNTLLIVGASQSSTPSVFTSGSAFDNDVEFLSDTYSLLSFNATSAQGGVVNMDSAGRFTYLPPVGYAGSDTFAYTIQDSQGVTNAATVTVNVVNRVWYVKNDAPGGGDGRSTSPFNALAPGQTASAANDIIFVHLGDGTNTNQNAGITLKSGQQLIGQGVNLVVGGYTLITAVSNPVIGNSGGDGVTINNVTTVTVRGLTIQGNTNAIDVTTTAATAGAITIQDNTFQNTGAEGVDVNQGSSGTLTLDFSNNTFGSGVIGNGFDARTTAGALQLAFSNNSLLANGTGALIDGSGGGALSITALTSNSVSGNTVGNGLSFTSVTFDATPGGAFQTVGGGTTAIGVSGNGVGASGLIMTNVSGDVSFADLDIYASNGAALQANGTTPYTGSAGFQIKIASAGVGIFEATSGPAANINQASIDLRLASLASTNSASTGVTLANLAGGSQFSAGGGSSISNATGTDFVVSGSNATITYNGAINDSAGAGVDLTSNTGSTITFNGTLTLSSGASTAFSATGGGTVNVTGSTNTLASTTGTAFNMVNTTIGASGVTFQSIASNGGANPGIILNNTGASGNFTVAGTGSAGSGGTIQSKTGNAIQLTTVDGVSLNYMNLTNISNNGISGTTVADFTMTNSNLTNIADTLSPDEAAVFFTNLQGVSTFTNNTITNAFDDQLILIQSGTTSLTSFTLTGNTFNGHDDDNDAFRYQGTNTTNATLIFKGNTFVNSDGDFMQVTLENTANLNLTVGGSTGGDANSFTQPGGFTILGGGLVLAPGGGAGWNGRLDFDIQGNTISGSNTQAINVNLLKPATSGATIDGFIRNNTISNANNNFGGSIQVTNGGLVSQVTVEISGNTITGDDGTAGIYVIGDQGGTVSTGARTDVRVLNNTISAPGAFNINAVHLNSSTTSANTGTVVCWDMQNNTLAGGGFSGTDTRIRQRFSAQVLLPSYAGGSTDTAAVQAYITGRGNTGVVSAATQSPGGYFGGTCNAPTLMQMQAAYEKIAALEAEQPTAVSSPESAPAQPAEQSSPADALTEPVMTNALSTEAAVAVSPAPQAPDATISVGPFTLPAGEQITLTFRVVINDPFPAAQNPLCNQASISGNNFGAVLTDDPDVAGGSDPTCTPLDRPSTAITSLNRNGPSPTNANAVAWTITFTEAISSLTSSNFTLVTSGLSVTPTITGVSANGGAPATQWTITATTGAGEGTLGLNLTNDTGLSHKVTNMPFTGQVYTIDHLAPDTSITGSPLNPTNSLTATFTFTGTDSSGIASFECDVDGGGFSACASPQNYTSLSEGNHTFQVRAIDNTGNVDATPASFSWTVDITAPDTSITGNPLNPTNSLTATFTFTGTDSSGIASFECDVDGGGFSACASPQNYTSLSEGSHTFQVRAIDNTGNVDATPASFSWTVDTTSPSVLLSSPTTDPTNSSPISVVITFSEPVDIGTGVGDLNITNGTASTLVGSGDTYTFDLTPSGQGLVTAVYLANSATDAAGNFNTASPTFSRTYDSIAPTVTMSSTASDPFSTSPVSVTVQFSEVVTGFTDTDIVPGNGVVGNFIAVDGDTYTFDLAPLAPGLVTADIAADVAHDAATNGNTAATQFSRTYTPPTVDLQIAKAGAVATAAPGEVVTYTLTYTNVGSFIAPSVTLTDLVPSELTSVAFQSSAAITPTGSAPYVWDLGSLAPNAGGIITVTGVVTGLPAGTIFTNTASISGAIVDPASANNTSAPVAVTVLNLPPLAGDDAGNTARNTPVTLAVLSNDTDPNNDLLLVAALGAPPNGAATTNGLSVTFTPTAGFTGLSVFTYTVSDGNGGNATASISVTVTQTTYQLYLPVVARNFGNSPDLVVQSLTVSGSNVQVVIKNQGNAPVVDEFWVDVYVAPNPVPTAVNQVWNDGRSTMGLVWGVHTSALSALGPGGVLTLTIGDANYFPDFSNFTGPLPAGTPVYAQVDSAGSTYGAVLETHESLGGAYNNIFGPATPTAMLVTLPEVPTIRIPTSDRLPRRPN